MNPSDLAFDANHIWHPYSPLNQPISPLAVRTAQGVTLELDDGRQLIDAMSSWWSVIHGYNHPTINAAAKEQIDQLSHVMFGGLTHQPAVDLCKTLVEITPAGLEKVFLCDSGSVAVDVAMKMALQYWQALEQPKKTKFAALQGGYHGDTLGAMSVCDPSTGMHHLFSDTLAQQHFIERPACVFGSSCKPQHILSLEQLLACEHETIAAVILEPIVQGAGGMYFYAAEYLQAVRSLCDRYGILLIADEIATGFGRTGKLFACEHADIAPDILCIGKAMTGGYLSLAATLTTDAVAEGIGGKEPGAFMHGPTFMGNPLACKIASTSIELLLQSNWQQRLPAIEKQLSENLLPLKNHDKIHDVRVLGAIGVIETHTPVDMHKVQKILPELGVWLRPFGRLVYTMPPFIIDAKQLDTVTHAMQEVVERCA